MTTSGNRFVVNGFPANGHTLLPLIDHRGPPADVESAGDDTGTVGPASGIDHGLVRELRRLIAERLSTHLEHSPGLSFIGRQELGRSLVADELSVRARDRIRTGQGPWPVEVEYAIADGVLAALFGLGRLQPLLDDPLIENIEVSGHDRVWVSYADGREVQVGPVADSDNELIELLQLLATRAGGSERSFTSAHPSLHLRLQDGSRLAAMAWTTKRPQVVIRRHRVRDVDLDGLAALGTLDACLVAFLRAALAAGKNLIVTGLQNAGKTTLVRALANEFPPGERFATIEREFELHLDDPPGRHPRLLALEAREGSSERDASGARAGEVTMSDLVVDALRMNLRRIIVGEVRGSEVRPMLDAMSTGDGSLCTLHARSAHHALDRIVTLCLSAGVGMTDTFAYRLTAGSVDLVVHLHLLDQSAVGGRKHRFVSEVLEVTGLGEYGRPVTTAVFAPGLDGRAVPKHRPACLPELVATGFDPGYLDQPAGLWSAPLDTVGRRS
jgi:pilus assembly protein CpaF